ncbi:MAG TPA: NAD(P)-dependent oxidoreductase, partial [Candidatus Binatia bacterium]|nr:NAD(P)-dependent oxidoreductase [Candidatus Binatia bacterium]
MTLQEARIVFLDAETYGDTSLRRFAERWPCTVHGVTSATDTIGRLSGHTVAVTNKVVIDRAVLESREVRDLRLIAVAATGTDIIDKEAATQRGVAVCNVPGYATHSVAQFTMALILQLATWAGRYADAVKAGEWQKSPVFSLLAYPAVELKGKKLGIVGYGNIGQAVAQMARAFGMEILVAARPGATGAIPADRLPVDRVLREADIISLHCPLTAGTKNLINRQSLSLMKSTAFLINTARGALIDESALIAALREKRIAAAALDVISQEP